MQDVKGMLVRRVPGVRRNKLFFTFWDVDSMGLGDRRKPRERTDESGEAAIPQGLNAALRWFPVSCERGDSRCKDGSKVRKEPDGDAGSMIRQKKQEPAHVPGRGMLPHRPIGQRKGEEIPGSINALCDLKFVEPQWKWKEKRQRLLLIDG